MEEINSLNILGKYSTCSSILKKHQCNGKKLAIIIPIPKKFSKRMSNFRGIFLMSIAVKTFNRIILNRIYDKISPHLRPFQARFRKRKSCTEQIHIIWHILEQYDQQKILLIMTFIDLKKAFDSEKRETMWKIREYLKK